MQAQISAQLPAVSKFCELSDAAGGRMGPFALGDGELAAGQVEENRAAAAGARVEGQQVAISRRIRLAGRPNARGSVAVRPE